MSHRRLIPLMCLLLFVALLSLPTRIFAQTEPPTPQPNPAEKWILSQLEAGEQADLTQNTDFIDDSMRTIRASLLFDLMQGKHHLGSNEIIIKNAVVSGPLVLKNAEIPYQFTCSNCKFKDNVNLSESHFTRSLILFNSEFNGEESNFNKMQGDGSIELSYAVFKRSYVKGCVNCQGYRQP